MGKIITGIVIVAVIVVGAILLLGGDSNDNPNEESGDVVATVNGEEITKDEFESQLALSIQSFEAQGANVDDPNNLALIREQVLNDLINNRLVLQGIAESDVSVSAEEVDAELESVKENAGGDEGFQEALEQADLTETELKDNIRQQLLVQKYLRANVDVESVGATDAEIQAFYDQNVAGQEDAPELEEIRDQIEQQIVATKQQQLINEFIASLRANADVEVLLNTSVENGSDDEDSGGDEEGDEEEN